MLFKPACCRQHKAIEHCPVNSKADAHSGPDSCELWLFKPLAAICESCRDWSIHQWLLLLHVGVYYEQGKLNEAIQSYQEAIAREPNFPEAYNNLGNALREASRPDEAIACYTMCIQLQFARPQNAQMARALQANPQMAAMQQAQRLGVAYNNLGGILKMQGRAAEAIACYEHVALLQPDSPEAHANLASAYKDAARQDTAIASYRRALQLRPDFPEAFANLVHSLQCICEWQDRQTLFTRLEGEVRRELAADRLPPVQPFHAMAYPFSAELALKISAKYAEYCAVTAARMGVPKLPHPPAKALQVRILQSLLHLSGCKSFLGT